MTVCRVSPTVTVGIESLNMMLDPSKTRAREKKKQYYKAKNVKKEEDAIANTEQN